MDDAIIGKAGEVYGVRMDEYLGFLTDKNLGVKR